MVDLKKFGLEKDWVYEAIVTTFSKNGKPNAAPMGFYTHDLKTIVIRPYRQTETHANILKRGVFVLNFAEDVKEFYVHIFDEEEAGKEKFRTTDVDAPALSCAISYWTCKVLDYNEEEGRTVVKCEVLDAIGKPVLVTRAPWLALECVIAATKLGAEKKKDEFLKKFIQESAATISRVAPDSEYERIARKCLEKSKEK